MNGARQPTPALGRVAGAWRRAARLTVEADRTPSPARRLELLGALREVEAALLEARAAGGTWPTAQAIAGALAVEPHDDGPGTASDAAAGDPGRPGRSDAGPRRLGP